MASAMVLHSLGEYNYVPNNTVVSEKKNITCMLCNDICHNSKFCRFDNFHIIRQGFLLSIDTFGVSHILPVLSLPFIAIHCYNTASKKSKVKDVTINILIQVLKKFVCAFWQ